jgi:hypothetical protein
MRPRGFEDAIGFYRTNKIPLGSWARWLEECFRVVNSKYNFNCTWISLVGMTAGMLEARGDFNAYQRAAKAKFNRPAEQRFLTMFVALAQALAGSNSGHLMDTYRGKLGVGLRRVVPGHVLAWPKPGVKRPAEVLQKMPTAVPIIRDSDLDFYIYLVHGYYVTSRNEVALQLLYEQYSTHPEAKRSVAFRALVDDEDIMAYFAGQRQKDMQVKLDK